MFEGLDGDLTGGLFLLVGYCGVIFPIQLLSFVSARSRSCMLYSWV
jgi:hypothetical protein